MNIYMVYQDNSGAKTDDLLAIFSTADKAKSYIEEKANPNWHGFNDHAKEEMYYEWRTEDTMMEVLIDSEGNKSFQDILYYTEVEIE